MPCMKTVTNNDEFIAGLPVKGYEVFIGRKHCRVEIFNQEAARHGERIVEQVYLVKFVTPEQKALLKARAKGWAEYDYRSRALDGGSFIRKPLLEEEEQKRQLEEQKTKI